jgi:DNA-damage-inducible protein J
MKLKSHNLLYLQNSVLTGFYALYLYPNRDTIIKEVTIMSKAAFIRARVEPKLKVTAEHVLSELGITPTQAITMLYSRIAREHEWPLELKIPNAKTARAIREARTGKGVTVCKDVDDLFKKLEE